jgi:DNA-binding NtrC family response regulator
MTRDSQVMFVDDEEGVRVSWERYFRGRGLKTTTAPDGATAIDRLSQHPVDVVVSDMRMPGKNGLELLEWLHVRQPDTRFIMLTGYGDRRLEWKARQLGAVEYLEKPVSPDVLAHAIDRALDPTRIAMALPFIEMKPAEAEPVVEAVAQTAPAVADEQAKPISAVQFVAAPFLGLAFVMFLPIIGIGAAVWALSKRVGGLFGRTA